MAAIQAGRQGGRRQADTNKHTYTYVHTINAYTGTHIHTQCTYRDVFGRVQESNIFQRLLPTFSAV